MVHGNQSIQYKHKHVSDANIHKSLPREQLGLLLPILVVDTLQEYDPHEDEEDDEVDHEKYREVRACFIWV